MKGSCLCKSITYEIDQLDGPIKHCACHTCRKAHAAAFNTAAAVRPEHFRWLTGESLLKAYESSPGKQRYFCSNCGSQLVAKKAGVPHWVLRVATLDDDPGTKPVAMIWASHAAPWLNQSGTIPMHAEWAPT